MLDFGNIIEISTSFNQLHAGSVNQAREGGGGGGGVSVCPLLSQWSVCWQVSQALGYIWSVSQEERGGGGGGQFVNQETKLNLSISQPSGQLLVSQPVNHTFI